MKRMVSIVLIIFIAGISGLLGAVGGALAVYQLEHQSLVSAEQNVQTTAMGSQEVVTGNSSPEAIFVSNTDVETSITQVVQRVGQAVVTVVGTAQVQMTPFGFTSTGEVSGSGVFISRRVHPHEQSCCGRYYRTVGCSS